MLGQPVNCIGNIFTFEGDEDIPEEAGHREACCIIPGVVKEQHFVLGTGGIGIADGFLKIPGESCPCGALIGLLT